MTGRLIIPLVMATLGLGAADAVRAAIYVPMSDFALGGVDHIQIRLGQGQQFDPNSLAGHGFRTFLTFDVETGMMTDGGWAGAFLNDDQNLAVATGPTTGNDLLFFALALLGDAQVDRPAFHYQSYLEGELVSSFDFYMIADGNENGETLTSDWAIFPGTWFIDQPLYPDFIPGDADRDSDVDAVDMLDHWQVNYTGPGVASGSLDPWEDGDWDGDGDIDAQDMLNHWQVNYTGPVMGPPPLATRLAGSPGSLSHSTITAVPEPTTLAALALGLGALTLRRSREEGRR